MVRETRHLWVGNLPENTREERIQELFKRHGRVQSVKLLPDDGDGCCATISFVDIRSASVAHRADNRLDEKPLRTSYYEPPLSSTGSVDVTDTPPTRNHSEERNHREDGSRDRFRERNYRGNWEKRNNNHTARRRRSRSGSGSASDTRSSSRSSSSDSSIRSQSSKSRVKSTASSISANSGEERRPTAVCIRNLPIRSSDSSLKDGLYHEYKKHGKVTTVRVIGKGESRYAVVSFKRAEDVEKAVELSQDKLFFGSRIEVCTYEGYEANHDNESKPLETEVDEYHPRATRTLFIGNLDEETTPADIKKHFSRFGDIIEVDIKRPQKATPVYAFIQFTTISSVVTSMKQMDGEVIGNSRIKLGFGRSQPSACVWVDGVAEEITEFYLHRQFQRFGLVTYTVVDRDRSQALIFFDQPMCAQAAITEMRGRPLGGVKMQVDFASKELQASFYEHVGKSKNCATIDGRRGYGFDRRPWNGSYPSSRYSDRTFVRDRPRSYDEYSQGSGTSAGDDSFEQELQEYGSRQRKKCSESPSHADLEVKEEDNQSDEEKKTSDEPLTNSVFNKIPSVPEKDSDLVLEPAQSVRKQVDGHRKPIGVLCRRKKSGDKCEFASTPRDIPLERKVKKDSRPGTPLCDETSAEDGIEPRRQRERVRNGPMVLPLPKFGRSISPRAQAKNRSSPAHSIKSPPPVLLSPTRKDPRLEPAKKPKLDSSSDSEISPLTSPNGPTLEEKLKQLDERYEKWSGSTRTTSSETFDKADFSKFRHKPKILDLNDLRQNPSDIVKTLLAKKSVFDEDSKRIENMVESYDGAGTCDSVTATKLSALPGIRIKPKSECKTIVNRSISVPEPPTSHPVTTTTTTSSSVSTPNSTDHALKYPFPVHTATTITQQYSPITPVTVTTAQPRLIPTTATTPIRRPLQRPPRRESINSSSSTSPTTQSTNSSKSISTSVQPPPPAPVKHPRTNPIVASWVLSLPTPPPTTSHVPPPLIQSSPISTNKPPKATVKIERMEGVVKMEKTDFQRVSVCAQSDFAENKSNFEVPKIKSSVVPELPVKDSSEAKLATTTPKIPRLSECNKEVKTEVEVKSELIPVVVNGEEQKRPVIKTEPVEVSEAPKLQKPEVKINNKVKEPVKNSEVNKAEKNKSESKRKSSHDNSMYDSDSHHSKHESKKTEPPKRKMSSTEAIKSSDEKKSDKHKNHKRPKIDGSEKSERKKHKEKKKSEDGHEERKSEHRKSVDKSHHADKHRRDSGRHDNERRKSTSESKSKDASKKDKDRPAKEKEIIDKERTKHREEKKEQKKERKLFSESSDDEHKRTSKHGSSDSDEPKKHSIFDLPEDTEPIYMSMYDKVKARSCKRKPEEDKPTCLSEKFDKLKQARHRRCDLFSTDDEDNTPKRGRKSRIICNSSEDEDSEYEVKNKPKPKLQAEARRASDKKKPRKTKSMIYSDTDSSDAEFARRKIKSSNLFSDSKTSDTDNDKIPNKIRRKSGGEIRKQKTSQVEDLFGPLSDDNKQLTSKYQYKDIYGSDSDDPDFSVKENHKLEKKMKKKKKSEKHRSLNTPEIKSLKVNTVDAAFNSLLSEDMQRKHFEKKHKEKLVRHRDSSSDEHNKKDIKVVDSDSKSSSRTSFEKHRNKERPVESVVDKHPKPAAEETKPLCLLEDKPHADKSKLPGSRSSSVDEVQLSIESALASLEADDTVPKDVTTKKGEKRRAVVSQEETDDAVAALLGETFSYRSEYEPSPPALDDQHPDDQHYYEAQKAVEVLESEMPVLQPTDKTKNNKENQEAAKKEDSPMKSPLTNHKSPPAIKSPPIKSPPVNKSESENDETLHIDDSNKRGRRGKGSRRGRGRGRGRGVIEESGDDDEPIAVKPRGRGGRGRARGRGGKKNDPYDFTDSDDENRQRKTSKHNKDEAKEPALIDPVTGMLESQKALEEANAAAAAAAELKKPLHIDTEPAVIKEVKQEIKKPVSPRVPVTTVAPAVVRLPPSTQPAITSINQPTTTATTSAEHHWQRIAAPLSQAVAKLPSPRSSAQTHPLAQPMLTTQPTGNPAALQTRPPIVKQEDRRIIQEHPKIIEQRHSGLEQTEQQKIVDHRTLPIHHIEQRKIQEMVNLPPTSRHIPLEPRSEPQPVGVVRPTLHPDQKPDQRQPAIIRGHLEIPTIAERIISEQRPVSREHRPIVSHEQRPVSREPPRPISHEQRVIVTQHDQPLALDRRHIPPAHDRSVAREQYPPNEQLLMIPREGMYDDPRMQIPFEHMGDMRLRPDLQSFAAVAQQQALYTRFLQESHGLQRMPYNAGLEMDEKEKALYRARQHRTAPSPPPAHAPLHTPPHRIIQTPPHASTPQADSLLQRYILVWQGLLALKNDQAAVQMRFVTGNLDVARGALPVSVDGSTLPLRMAQRMRLEKEQLDGVARKMQTEAEHCMLLALPIGRDHMDVLQQSNNLRNGFITYLQLKQAAGIINVAAQSTQQPAYVIHIFPSCDFANENLARIAPDLLHSVADIAHLLVIIATV